MMQPKIFENLIKHHPGGFIGSVVNTVSDVAHVVDPIVSPVFQALGLNGGQIFDKTKPQPIPGEAPPTPIAPASVQYAAEQQVTKSHGRNANQLSTPQSTLVSQQNLGSAAKTLLGS